MFSIHIINEIYKIVSYVLFSVSHVSCHVESVQSEVRGVVTVPFSLDVE